MKKQVLIFGVGAAGRAIYRKILADFNVIGFLENNLDLVGKSYEGVEIFSVKDTLNLEFDAVLMGGVWANEMKNQLLTLGISDERIEILDEKDISFSTPNRQKTTDLAIKKFDEFCKKHKISYFIDGSSMLCILRKRPLSVVSDVDIVVKSYKNLEFLAQNLGEIFSDFDIKVVRFSSDDLVKKRGDIFKIVVSSFDDEKMVLDINVYHEYGKCVILGYNGKYFYVPKEMFSKIIWRDYASFSLPILADFDAYLTLVYGKNYMQIPKQFLASDYGNLVSVDELNKICF
ncbi:hypothetical protein [Campylobacter gastrosuis]|uniref:LicD family protein n=1 Tax=Campylobacter gastrosuis TaxID=2974576 RepID=A0ABT7HQ10_9BACT|nr:hypothetical protein [Campylobacter gastrosuis]MDL0089007.1 hypothetical protein [Campylobacter gastrosuis]